MIGIGNGVDTPRLNVAPCVCSYMRHCAVLYRHDYMWPSEERDEGPYRLQKKDVDLEKHDN